MATVLVTPSASNRNRRDARSAGAGDEVRRPDADVRADPRPHPKVTRRTVDTAEQLGYHLGTGGAVHPLVMSWGRIDEPKTAEFRWTRPRRRRPSSGLADPAIRHQVAPTAAEQSGGLSASRERAGAPRDGRPSTWRCTSYDGGRPTELGHSPAGRLAGQEADDLVLRQPAGDEQGDQGDLDAALAVHAPAVRPEGGSGSRSRHLDGAPLQ